MQTSTCGVIEQYEEASARLLDLQHAVAFGYSRHALVALMAALGVKAGDEVVLSPLTCKMVPLAVLSLGALPVYADISEKTLNLEPESVTTVLGPNCRMIIFQHTYGGSENATAVGDLANTHGIPMIDDCAQCLPTAGARPSRGQWGIASIFSNNALKPLAAGAGGLAVTNNEQLARALRAYRDTTSAVGPLTALRVELDFAVHHYLLWPRLYWPLFELARRISPSYRVRPIIEEIQAELMDKPMRITRSQARRGLRFLKRAEKVAEHRTRCCQIYRQALCHIGLLTNLSGEVPLLYFPILTKQKLVLLQEARRRNIELIPWPGKTPIYPLETSEQLRQYGYRPGSCPVAERVSNELLGLPTHPKIDAAFQSRLVTLILEVCDAPPPARSPQRATIARSR
jgi:dTDP-4-amino-4,6-dideoxygalactose transaminase